LDDREDDSLFRSLPVPDAGEQPSPRLVTRTLLGAALGLILVVAVSRGIDRDTVWTDLRNADGLWVGLALMTVLATTAIKVWRWQWLFSDLSRPGLLQLGSALLVGQMLNAILPARLGDLARAHLGAHAGPASTATALGTIAAEKAFDVLFLLVCAGLTALVTSLPRWLDASLALTAALGGTILVIAMVLPEERVLGRIERKIYPSATPSPARRPGRVRTLSAHGAQRLLAAVRRGLIGLEALRRPRKALAVCAWSVPIWALAAATNYVLFRAFDLKLSVGAALSLLTLLHVGMAPPSSPGRLGVFHALTVVTLQAFDVDRTSGLAYATVLHAVVYGPQVALGALAVTMSRGLGWRRR
jgi:uncharacterized protein (TIRG00374 family)